MNHNQSISQYNKMTQTSVSALIVKLSIPTVISMLVTNIYNMADTAFVGQLGNSASGAVGIVFGFMAILQAVGCMFGQGAGGIISRMLGKKDEKNASMIASTGFLGALLIGAVISVIGLIWLDSLVMLLGCTQTIKPYAKTYISWILVAAPFITASFVMNSILRYEGRAAFGMAGLLAGALLNICGDFILMFGLRMGIAGAGISTALSQFVSFCVLISMFFRGKTQCRLSIHSVTHNMRQILDILATGMPSLLRQGLSSITSVFLNVEAAVYGDAAVAAMSIVSRIVMFVFSISIGIGQGFQPVSGFNYGAGKYRRVRKAYWITILLAEVIMLAMVTMVMLCSNNLIQIFRDDATVIQIGTRALHLQCLSLLFLPISMVTEMQLQSTGKRLGASVLLDCTRKNGQ